MLNFQTYAIIAGVILTLCGLCSKCAFDKGYESHRAATEKLVRETQATSVSNTHASVIYQQAKEKEVEHAKGVSAECAYVTAFDYIGVCVQAMR